MPDQAEGLRELVDGIGEAERRRQSKALDEILNGAPGDNDHADLIRGKSVIRGLMEDMSADGHQNGPRVGRLGKGLSGMDEFDRAYPNPSPEIDYKALYLRLKDEFTTLSRGRNLGQNEPGKPAFGATQDSHKALWALEQMERAETMASLRYIHVPAATPETFARVRDEMRGES